MYPVIDRIIAMLFFFVGLMAIAGGLLMSQGVFHMFNPWSDVMLVIAGFMCWLLAWGLLMSSLHFDARHNC